MGRRPKLKDDWICDACKEPVPKRFGILIHRKTGNLWLCFDCHNRCWIGRKLVRKFNNGSQTICEYLTPENKKIKVIE
jgi:hypothetical protein